MMKTMMIPILPCAAGLLLLTACVGEPQPMSSLEPTVQPEPTVQLQSAEQLTTEQREAKLREMLLQLADRVGEEGLRLFFVFSHDAAARNSEYEYGTALHGLTLEREPIGSLSAEELRALARAERTPDFFEQLTPDFALDWDLPDGAPQLGISITQNARYGITIRRDGLGALYLHAPELHARIFAMLQEYHKGRGRTLDEFGMPINEPQRRAMVELVASLPAASVYEESPEEFRRTVEAGEFSHWGTDVYRLSIGGDGCFGPRAFMLYVRPKEDELQMVMDAPADEDGPARELHYNYNPETGEMEYTHSTPKQQPH